MSTAEALPTDPRRAAERLVSTHGASSAWLDAFSDALDRQRAGQQLARVLAVWGISQAEAGRLFGVTRQAVSKWLRTGVPSDRVTPLADLAAATDLLVRHLKRDRIPAVVRRPAPALNGASLLDLVGADQTAKALQACRDMFDFTSVHA